MTQEQIAASNGSAKGVEFVVYDTSTRGIGKSTKTIYVGVAPDYASAAGLAFNLYKSTNGGKSWTGVETPVAGFHIPHMVRADDGMFYVAFTQGPGPGANGPARFYRFDGATWTLLRSFDPDQWTSFGFGGVSVHGTGATTRIALGVTNTWGNWEGQPVVQLSDDAGATWREIAAMKPHTPDGGFSGWVDDVEIDPFDRDHILHVSGGGVWETRDASSADPSWVFLVEGIEETANVTMVTPPAGSSYLLLNSSMDVGMLVHTALDQSPTLGPKGNVAFGTGQCADMAWSTPSYIAAVGAATWGSTVLHRLRRQLVRFRNEPPGCAGQPDRRVEHRREPARPCRLGPWKLGAVPHGRQRQDLDADEPVASFVGGRQPQLSTRGRPPEPGQGLCLRLRRRLVDQHDGQVLLLHRWRPDLHAKHLACPVQPALQQLPDDVGGGESVRRGRRLDSRRQQPLPLGRFGRQLDEAELDAVGLGRQ
jgi:hypothetical protein